jgi:hypothetical protein
VSLSGERWKADLSLAGGRTLGRSKPKNPPVALVRNRRSILWFNSEQNEEAESYLHLSSEYSETANEPTAISRVASPCNSECTASSIGTVKIAKIRLISAINNRRHRRFGRFLAFLCIGYFPS